MVLVISDLSFTFKTYNNERFTLHHRRYPYYRLGIWLFLLFCRRNNSRIISYSYYSFNIRGDKKSMIIESQELRDKKQDM